MADNFDPSKPSEGFGDTIARITHAIGIDKVAEGVARAVGREDCGCSRRRETLNKLFPYQTQKTPDPIPTPVDQSNYVYEGIKTFKVLVPFSIQHNGAIIDYIEGAILPISTSDYLYPSLKVLLENNTLQSIS